MRSEFENSLGHTDGFHDGYVKWNELSNQYESSDEDYLDVAEWMNGALAIYEKRQTEVDELQNNINLLNEALDIKEQLNQKLREREDELQKRVCAVQRLIEDWKEWSKNNQSHEACIYVEENISELEQALNGGIK